MDKQYKGNTPAAEEQMTISIRVTLPDVSDWRVYKFARQYPYLALLTTILALMALVLLADAVGWIWHIIHKSAIAGQGK